MCNSFSGLYIVDANSIPATPHHTPNCDNNKKMPLDTANDPMGANLPSTNMIGLELGNIKSVWGCKPVVRGQYSL